MCTKRNEFYLSQLYNHEVVLKKETSQMTEKQNKTGQLSCDLPEEHY